jgi:hypothetical protein
MKITGTYCVIHNSGRSSNSNSTTQLTQFIILIVMVMDLNSPHTSFVTLSLAYCYQPARCASHCHITLVYSEILFLLQIFEIYLLHPTQKRKQRNQVESITYFRMAFHYAVMLWSPGNT